jgi:p70 ribosomal S6 kinase
MHDIRWAVGVLAWEMLTSKNPFEGKTKEVTLKKILTGKLALPSYLDSQTHSLLKGVGCALYFWNRRLLTLR